MQTAVVIKRHFAHLLEMLSKMPDGRERPQYKTEELLMAAISIFLFKRGSRNHADNTAKKGVTKRTMSAFSSVNYQIQTPAISC